MIREEVERLRGFVFTDEELRDIIIPAICARNNNWEKEKCLWKVKYYFASSIGLPVEEGWTEIRDLTLRDAIEYFNDWFEKRDNRYVKGPLYYKKEGEWVEFVNKE